MNGAPASAYLDNELARMSPGTLVHFELENRICASGGDWR